MMIQILFVLSILGTCSYVVVMSDEVSLTATIPPGYMLYRTTYAADRSSPIRLLCWTMENIAYLQDRPATFSMEVALQ